MSSCLTLAGYLDLIKITKSLVSGRKKRYRYWFLFDESRCQLRYYENEKDLRFPIGTIDMTSTKISLSLESSEEGRRTVKISHPSAEYLLISDKPENARYWYVQLLEKKELAANLSKHNTGAITKQRKLRKSVPSLSVEASPWISTLTPCHKPDSPSSPNPEGQLVASKFINIQGSDTTYLPGTGGGKTGSGKRGLLHSSSVDNIDKVTGNGRSFVSVNQPQRFSLHEGLLLARHPASPTLPPKDPWWNLSTKEEDAADDQLETKQLNTQVSNFEMRIAALLEEKSQREDKLEEQTQLVSDLREIINTLSEGHPDRQVKQLVANLMETRQTITHLEDVNKTISKLLLKNQIKQENQKETEEKLKEDISELNSEFVSFKAAHVRTLTKLFTIPTEGIAFSTHPLIISREEEQGRAEIISLFRKDFPEEICNVIDGDSLCDFQDAFGDNYHAEDECKIFLFLARKLHQLYTEQAQLQLEQKWIDVTSTMKEYKEGLLDMTTEKKELKNLFHTGLPIRSRLIRVLMWKSCINKWIGDKRSKLDAEHAPSYYQYLLDKEEECLNKKQIKLDLHRTLPGNTNFKAGTDAIDRMNNILTCFSFHNPKVGYTQGMNLLVAIPLFFLDEESTFWCLIAVIEKILSPEYFSSGLLASQADQAVFQELVAKYLPNITNHLQKLDINITFISLNWFLTIFGDSLPTEPTLRIWDSVLYEGKLAIFRFSLALIQIYEAQLLKIKDPVNMLQFLKSMSRHTFDIDELFQVAYSAYSTAKLASYIGKRHDHHLNKLMTTFKKQQQEMADLLKKEKRLRDESHIQKEELASNPQAENNVERDLALQSFSRQRLYTAQSIQKENDKPRWVCSSLCLENEAWLMFHRPDKTISSLSVIVGSTIRVDPVVVNIPSDLTCVHYHSASDIVFFGTLNFTIVAVDHENRTLLWTFRLADSVVDVVSQENNVYVALADGTITIFKNPTKQEPPLSPFIKKIGNDCIQCLLVVPDNRLWCATSSSIIILEQEYFEEVHSISLNTARTHSINGMHISQHGVWITYRSSTIVCLYDLRTYRSHLSVDYMTVVSEGKEIPDIHNETVHGLRVTGMLVQDGYLWLGTGGGSVIIFEISKDTSSQNISETPQPQQQQQPDTDTARRKFCSSHPGLLVLDTTEECEQSAVSDLERSESQIRNTSRSSLYRGTLRRKGRRKEAQVIPGDYKLVYITGHSVGKTNDNVKKFLAFNLDKQLYVMSCVRSGSSDCNPIQIWSCISEDPLQWTFRNVNYVDFV